MRRITFFDIHSVVQIVRMEDCIVPSYREVCTAICSWGRLQIEASIKLPRVEAHDRGHKGVAVEMRGDC